MHHDIDDLIQTAIMSKNIMEFRYQGYHRTAEPHLFGIHKGRKQLLAYQTAGQSASGNIPGWRRVNVDEMSLAKVTSQTFAGQRPYLSGEHSDFDTILAVVSDRNDITD